MVALRTPSAQRRRDVFLAPRVSAQPSWRRRALSAADRRRGCDALGRFIGRDAVERGWQFFWSAPHRRAAAPLVRQPSFGYPSGPWAGLRRLRSGLGPGELCAIWERRQRGEPYRALATAFGVTMKSILLHCRPSPHMRAALAAACPS